MRLTLVAPVILTALATCSSKSSPPPPPPGQDLTIEVALVLDNNKCLARLKDTTKKDAANAIGWTNHAVIWKVVANDCGEKKKINKKALGLKSMKLKSTGEVPPWFKDCKPLDDVPPGGGGDFRCQIPSSKDWRWERPDETKIYEYVIDGDEVEPGDPDLGIKRNG